MITQHEQIDSNNLYSLAGQLKKKVNNLVFTYFSLIIGTIILFLAITAAVVVAVVWGINEGVMNIRFIVFGGGIIIAAAVCVGFVLNPLSKIFAPREEKGTRIDRKKYPELSAMIDDVVSLAGCRQPKHVFVSGECNAYVYYSHVWGYFFSGGRQNLTIGLPLLYSLNMTELKSVLSHEFGHFTQKSVSVNRIANLSEFICASIARAEKEFEAAEDGSMQSKAKAFARFITKIMIRQYYKIAPLNKVLSRAQEFDADSFSYSIVGSGGSVSALNKIERFAGKWHNFEMILRSLIQEDRRCPEDSLSCFDSFIGYDNCQISGFALSPSEHFIEPVREIGSRLSNVDDMSTHPSTYDRCSAILSYPEKETIWDDRPAYSIFDKRLVEMKFNAAVTAVKELMPNADNISVKRNLSAEDLQKWLDKYYIPDLRIFYNDPVFFAASDCDEKATSDVEEFPFTKDNADMLLEYYYAKSDMDTLKQIMDENSPVRKYRYQGRQYDGQNVPIREHSAYLKQMAIQSQKLGILCNEWLSDKTKGTAYEECFAMFRITAMVNYYLLELRTPMQNVYSIAESNDRSTKALEYISAVDARFTEICAPLFDEKDGKPKFFEVCDQTGVDSDDRDAARNFVISQSESKSIEKFIRLYPIVGNALNDYSRMCWQRLYKNVILCETTK